MFGGLVFVYYNYYFIIFFKVVKFNVKINLECCKIGIKEYLINFIFV